jgi:hypothetical protein
MSITPDLLITPTHEALQVKFQCGSPIVMEDFIANVSVVTVISTANIE